MSIQILLRKLCVHMATVVWAGSIIFSWAFLAYLIENPIHHREIYISLIAACNLLHAIYWEKVIIKAYLWAGVDSIQNPSIDNYIGSTFSSKDLAELLVQNKHLLPDHVRNAIDANTQVQLSVNAQYSEIKVS